MTDRYQQYRKLAVHLGVDAVVLVPGANFMRLYGANFVSHERPLAVVIAASGELAAVVPAIELSSFEPLEFEGRVFAYTDQDGYQGAFDDLMAHLQPGSIGVEGQVMRVFVEQAFRKAAGEATLRVRDLNAEIGALRLRKTAEELQSLRRAIAISEVALAETLEAVRPGMSEKAVEALLVQRLFAAGAEGLSFDPIVAAGANSANSHASAGERAIGVGDTLLIDFGARFGGMCADITRTCFVQRASEEQLAVYEWVLAANAAGIDAVRAGATAHAIDEAATAVLERSPFADRIRHKTGHGLGREVHEAPQIMRGNDIPLEAGMVFTVEPGLYESGAFGVRIEDDVLVAPDGSAEVLTRFDKAPLMVGQTREI